MTNNELAILAIFIVFRGSNCCHRKSTMSGFVHTASPRKTPKVDFGSIF
jgi:hypothetical protein